MAESYHPPGNRTALGLERARVACQRCHEKKVRCDAFKQTPCSGCAANGAKCALITSQRGRYTRKRRNLHFNRETRDHETLDPGKPAEQPAITIQPWPQQSPSSGHHRPSPRSQEDDDGPEMLYARIAATSVSGEGETIRPSCEPCFLGETFSLTYVVHDVLAPFFSKGSAYQKRLHLPVANPALRQQPPLRDKQRVASAQVDLLKRQELHVSLEPEALNHLIGLYFDFFHPAFPIVDKTKYQRAEHADKYSQLVLNGILMIAVTLCDKAVLNTFGFGDRHAARLAFYKAARFIYDSDAENDKLDSIRGLFLMSFWWGGPNEQKDSWHWLAVAISLAQTLGLHRSTKTSRIAQSKASEWKILWWSLRIRDVLVSASIGRPQHIWQGDSDVDHVGPEDVAAQLEGSSPEAFHYFIQTGKLSSIVSRIIASRYSCSQIPFAREDRASLEDALSQFYSGIPPELRFEFLDAESREGLWAAMLNMAYNFAMILLCRPTRALSGEEQLQIWGNPRKAVTAANSITRTTEDLLSASIMTLCQVHTIAALFNALAIHVYTICNADAINKGLAETRARVCMIGLQAMEEAWPVGTWVLRLFDSIMARLKAPVRTSSANIPKQRTQNCEPQSREPKEPFTKDATTAVDSALEASDLAPDQPVMADAENPQDISHEHDIDQSVFDNRSFVNDGQWDQPYTEMDARVLSSVFAFEESMDRVSADQGIFLQWLDDGLLQGTDLNSWSW